MDYTKSGDPEIGVVIERRKWVEGMEIGDRISDIGVGTGSNMLLQHTFQQLILTSPLSDPSFDLAKSLREAQLES